MSEYSFPVFPEGSFSVDRVAVGFLPQDTPTDIVPMNVVGDGNCLYRAASVLAYGREDDHTQLQAAVVQEIKDYAAAYADLFTELAKSVDSQADYRSLLSQTCVTLQARFEIFLSDQIHWMSGQSSIWPDICPSSWKKLFRALHMYLQVGMVIVDMSWMVHMGKGEVLETKIFHPVEHNQKTSLMYT